MEKNYEDEAAVNAAAEYAKTNTGLVCEYNKVCDAFLAGVEFQKRRYQKPDKEYYGF